MHGKREDGGAGKIKQLPAMSSRYEYLDVEMRDPAAYCTSHLQHDCGEKQRGRLTFLIRQYATEDRRGCQLLPASRISSFGAAIGAEGTVCC